MIDYFESAICELKQTHSVIGVLKLSESDSALYNQLLSLKKAVYNHNEKIIVLQDCDDVYDYEDLPGRNIVNLQKQLSKIDISNFFVLLMSSNPNISKELEQARKLYSTDQYAIQNRVIEGEAKITVRKFQDTFCVLPWIHLYVGTDGTILPCCVADHQHPMGNINQDTIEKILVSTEYNKLRLNMLSGKRSKQCHRCYQQEDAGLPSLRQGHLKRWPQIQPLQVDPTGIIKKVAPVYLDIRLNNICNLKCRMCSSYFSSAIAQEEHKLFGSSTATILSAEEKKTALTKILKFVPTAEKIYFAGGEPLIMLEHYKILDHLVINNNTNLELTYNTNFTTLQYQGRDITDLWQKFSNVKLSISLDAEGAAAEYVRSGCNWSVIESNLQKVQKSCPHVDIQVTSVVGFLNLLSLIKLQRSWHNSGKLNITKFFVLAMVGPEHLILPALPLNHKQRLDPLIKEHIVWCQEQSANVLASQWQDVLGYMWSADSSYCLLEFNRIMSITDQHRHESFKDIFPEYKDL
jgi:radical SAM protein with 4Fe4S-binding SPASM domain